MKRERGSVAQGELSLLRSSVSAEEAGRGGCDGRAG